MIERVLGAAVACVAVSVVLGAHTKTVPRPPAFPPPASDSAAPDGYQPPPQWLCGSSEPLKLG